MIKKIDILGVQLDNYTVREAIMQVETYLTNDVLNTIECVSMHMLMDAAEDPTIKAVISSLNLAVIGEKEILQAAGIGTMQRIKETEENDFFYEFFKRVERNKKSVFILGESQNKIDRIKEQLMREYPKLILVGEYATENCVGNLEAVINDMNATTPCVIVSVLPTPLQEHFFWEHKDKMNANIWYGLGESGMECRKHGLRATFRSILHLGRLKSSMNKYQKTDVKNEA